jgi:cell division protein FtsL
MKTTFVVVVSALAVWAGVARSQETATPTHDTRTMMTGQQHMMMSMQASDKKLDDLVAELNAAKGNARVDKLIAVVNELVAGPSGLR